MLHKKLIQCFIVFLFLMPVVFAETATIDLEGTKQISIVMHALQLVLVILVLVISNKLFNLTKPINLFYIVFLAMCFFMISPILYLQIYLSEFIPIKIHSPSMSHFIAQLALTAMLFVIMFLFYTIRKEMKKQM